MVTDIPVVVAMSEPLFIKSSLSAYDAMKMMIDKGRRYCILLDENNGPVGIVTITDIIKHILLERVPPENVKIYEIATKKLVTISPDTSIEEALKIMKKYGVSKLPIVDNGKIVGIVTENELIDILPYIIDPLKELVNHLIDIINNELKEEQKKKEKVKVLVKTGK
ncbi:CBS domain-containing protein [Methanocaldococcus fervens]|uniref:Signal transduction protein with CBS domains n=1 Tax=Methanocaldococcus fervens (strain DSM 4213 / JCM 15782 / AG86) TaxID=573064 RepID=C7P959_METFA|nr:CBS domain-containing protein [Methanocaldococcus fervens]ACV25091.1 putative signal transduction protein with CBS domains [Methanocaldococcus fervens AG86]